jgi:ACS family hexuronate transporter-like MFS transporter
MSNPDSPANRQDFSSRAKPKTPKLYASDIPQNVAVARVGYIRWIICALLFFATTINYVDRQVLGILAPDLQKSIGWSEADYGFIVTAFQLAYAIGLLVVGRSIDRLGTRNGYSISVIIWSVAAVAHSLAQNAVGFGVARFALGFGEAGNFPAAIKGVAEWFPKKERALATGIFNAGANVGAFIGPLIVPWIAINFGWRWAFILTELLGFVWLIFWRRLFRKPEEHSQLSPSELAYIRSGPGTLSAKIPLTRLLPHRQLWAFALGKFLTDPIWWFWLYWLPKFLNQTRGLSLASIGVPLITIYVAADLGSIGGGWLSSSLIKSGLSVNASRKIAMLVCAVCMLPVLLVPSLPNLWVAVGLLSLATAAHQGWSANLFTLASDMFPQGTVGAVVGFGGMAGAVGGMLIASAAGLILQATGSYVPLFIIASSAYLLALVVIQLLVPKLEPWSTASSAT